jgi:hypothetical protein
MGAKRRTMDAARSAASTVGLSELERPRCRSSMLRRY